MLKVQNLTKIYGSQKAVNDISFEAKAGEIVGFLGPNGAGKSTTMKIATCYLSATSGNVEVCGFNVLHNPMEVRQNIGYLPEHNPLYLDMYVKEFLGFIGGIYDLKGQNLQKRILEVIELFGLTLEYKKKIGQLSKGYRQRVGLAQALIHDPKVLILDEPTTGLDPILTEMVDNLIFSTHNLKEGTTSLVVSHDLHAALRIGDYLAMLDNGKVLLFGTPQDFLNTDIDLVKRFVSKGVHRK